MHKYSQSSLVDFLMQKMPSLANIKKQAKYVQSNVAQNLFNIWKDPQNEVGKKVYKKPTTISSQELNGLISSGLVSPIGDKLKITAKGSQVIKIMILGDDRSVYQDDGKNVQIRVASAKVKQPSKKKKAQNDWWNNLGF